MYWFYREAQYGVYMQKNKRKAYLINPLFQLQFMGWMGGIAFSVVAVFSIAHVIFFKNLRKLATEGGLAANHVFYRFIQDRESEMNAITLYTAGVVLLVVIIAGLLLSNKIAGPLYRFHQHLKKSSVDKKLTKVAFRKGDYFSEIADEYNNHINQKND